MSQVTVSELRDYLRVIHSADDTLIQLLIDGAESEACRFMGRTELPTLPLEYPVDSDGNPTGEEVPSSDDPIAPDVRVAIYLLVQGEYEGSKIEEREAIRRAAEIKLMPYRVGLGV